jgi:hypothetical protein
MFESMRIMYISFHEALAILLDCQVKMFAASLVDTVTDGGRLADEVFSALPYGKRAYTSL